ncbi:hypothetical protein T492DRAFT_249814 [Pavlovales sp. CCMP2436]|nr:hypothetical protein T492DRAFT_249814 [Pavlovales sp. CCMP2436]
MRMDFFCVFDGHGGQNGALAAQVATDSANWAQLRTDPTRLFTNAFEQAHKAIRVAIKATSADISEDSLCVLVEDGEAVDGGTTATVCVVIDGSTLIHAQVLLTSHYLASYILHLISHSLSLISYLSH